jgi:hypothetical protein
MHIEWLGKEDAVGKLEEYRTIATDILQIKR